MKNARSNENQTNITKLLATTANPRAGSSALETKAKASRPTHSFNVDLPINKYQSSTFILAKKATP